MAPICLFSRPRPASNKIQVPTYERHIQITATVPDVAADAPDPVPLAAGSPVQCLNFPTNGTDYAYLQWEVPTDWVGGENITIEVDWAPYGAAMTGTDSVIWTAIYVSRAEGEDLTVTTSSPSQITNDADNAQDLSIHSPFTIVYNDANNPLTKGDHLFFRVTRDSSDTFAGGACVTAFEIIYNSNAIPISN